MLLTVTRFPSPKSLTAVTLITGMCLVGPSGREVPINAQAPGTTQVTYTPSAENLANPERGFFHASSPFFLGTERRPLTVSALQRIRDEGLTLVRANYVFDEFREAPVPQTALDAMTADFAAVRTAGLKMILRVMYSFPCAGTTEPCGPATYGTTDIPVATVLMHIASLAPVFQANADVLASLEMGFVGAWGEWHSSTNHLVEGEFGIVNANSTLIVQGILNALPVRRAAVIRYPHQKQALFGSAPLTAA